MARDGDIGPLDVAAITLHEMYESFRRAGFSRTDALTIISKTTAEIITQQMTEVAKNKAQDPDKP